MRAAAGIFLMVAALLATSAGSVAAKDFEPVGGPGARAGEFRDHCPPNTFLVGLEVKSGAWVDRMAIRCAAVKDDGSLGPLVPSPPYDPWRKRGWSARDENMRAKPDHHLDGS
jgi:hypothetical protein